MLYVISMILNTITIVLLMVIMVFLIKKYIKDSNESQSNTDTVTRVDKDGIVHTLEFDLDSGHIKSYRKSNGEFYHFKNDEKGRLIEYEDHFGIKYKWEFDEDNNMVYYEDSTDKKYGFSRDEEGRLSYLINYNTGIGLSYYYNEDGKLYLTEDSEGRKSYVLSNIPKDMEV